MNELEPKEGFSMDTRVVGTDEVAKYYAEQWFGPRYVANVVGTLHRSVASHEFIRADLMKYDRKYVPPIVRDDPTYRAVLQSVQDQFTCKEPIIPLTIGGAMNHPDFPRDKSPGLPWTQKGYRTKGDVLSCKEGRGHIFRLWEEIGQDRPHTGLPDTCAFFRSQLAPLEKNKIRAVWGIPIDVIVEEFRFFKPYIAWLESTNAPIAYGIEMATGGMAHINDMCSYHKGNTLLMTDYSQFDSSIPPWLIRDAFDIVYKSFDLKHVRSSDGRVWPVSDTRTKRRIKKLISYFIATPIRLPDGTRYRKTGGVPSGSTFTNIIDTIVNAIVMRYVIYHTSGHFPLGEMYLGDDSFIVVQGVTNLKSIANLALEKFGMVIHEEKSYATTNPGNVQFLGYYNRNGLPFKPQAQLVASFIYPERHVKNNTIRVARAVGQMWSTMHSGCAVTWHHLVEDMMRDLSVSLDDVEEHMKTHPGQFRYLRMLGIDPRKIGLPRPVNGTIIDVDPPWTSKKEYKPVSFDIHDLYERSKKA